MSDTLVGTPVAACMVVEPTRSTAKKMAVRIVARGWKLADEGHGHAVEAVAVDEVELGAQQVGAAAQARDGTGDDEAHQYIPLDDKAVELRRRHVQSHRPEPKALGGVEQEVVDQTAPPPAPG